MVFPELENAWGEGKRMERPVLASLSLGDLCDIRVEKSTRQRGQAGGSSVGTSLKKTNGLYSLGPTREARGARPGPASSTFMS